MKSKELLINGAGLFVFIGSILFAVANPHVTTANFSENPSLSTLNPQESQFGKQ
ncbi:MAG: hypothetical protein QNJ38_18585 [Prochloraceae cyanobacterium]|nr:hypothetical protein [Prochloraceae cyanobacterium]